jgi:hypothetical protein
MLDNSRFVGAVVGSKQLGFDPRVITEKVSNVEKSPRDYPIKCMNGMQIGDKRHEPHNSN